MEIKFLVEKEFHGQRFDYVAAAKTDGYSRSLIAQFIRNGEILVSGKIRKPSFKLNKNDLVSGHLPDIKDNICPDKNNIYSKNYFNSIDKELLQCSQHSAESYFDILHEDSHVIVINKKADVVVHPAPGNVGGTLVNALINYCPQIKSAGEDILRPGIVHRLDKDTSGVMVIAKNNHSFLFLKKEFMQRRIEKRYIALAAGIIKEDHGKIILPISRHPAKRKMMSALHGNGRYAETIWRVLQRYDNATLVEAELKTGRTHQVRVHFKAIGHPLIGDSVYGFRKGHHNKSRQMLHAWKLSFRHPWSGIRLDFTAPLPEDMIGFDFINNPLTY